MNRIRLIHWNQSEAESRAVQIQSHGYTVNAGPVDPVELRELRRDPPSAIVIDLNRLPSHGRDVALALRESKATRNVPIVFVEGDPQKLARLQVMLPDAVYTTWSRIATALRRAIAHPPTNPVVPQSRLDGYSGTPLPKKLGIKQGHVVALLSAPDDFEQTLGELPDGVTLRRDARSRRDLTIWFTRSQHQLRSKIQKVTGAMCDGGLWIAWPKKGSGVVTDISEPVVREVGLASGLVDYKICAIDATWSGLKFARRKSEST